MNEKTGGSRGLRLAGTLAAVAATALLAAACGGSAPPTKSAPTYAQVLSLVRCMRSHGEPNFPDPNSSGSYSFGSNGSLVGADGSSVDINSSQAQAAYGDCRHLVPGGPSISQLEQIEQEAQQKRAETLPALLKWQQCVRSHGEPDFTIMSSGQGTPPGKGPGVNPSSPQFQAALRACQHLLPPGAKVSISSNHSTPQS
jgi:hypothetical protein